MITNEMGYFLSGDFLVFRIKYLLIIKNVKVFRRNRKERRITRLKDIFSFLVASFEVVEHSSVNVSILNTLMKVSAKCMNVNVFTFKGGGTSKEWRDEV